MLNQTIIKTKIIKLWGLPLAQSFFFPLALVLRQCRVKQWAKNGIIFLPLIFSDNLHHIAQIIRTVEAFLFFSLLASAAYILNDLIDLPYDRLHPRKKIAHWPVVS